MEPGAPKLHAAEPVDHTLKANKRKKRKAHSDSSPAYEACLHVDDFYSDMLYQPWHCAHVPLKTAWLSGDGIPRRASLSPEAFREEFEIPNRPVILTDVVSIHTHHLLRLLDTALCTDLQSESACIWSLQDLLPCHILPGVLKSTWQVRILKAFCCWTASARLASFPSMLAKMKMIWHPIVKLCMIINVTEQSLGWSKCSFDESLASVVSNAITFKAAPCLAILNSLPGLLS